MTKNKLFTEDFINKIADLSRLSISKDEALNLSDQFNASLDIIENLNKVNVENIPEAYNITGLKNIFREYVVDNKRLFTQKEALSNAKRVHKGFFVVKGLFNNE